MKNKLFLIFFLVLVFSSVSVIAVNSFNWVNLTYPTNQSYNKNGTVFFQYNVSGTDGANSSNFYTCSLYHNATGAWTLISSTLNVSNASSSNFTVTNLADTVVGWTVGCYTSRNSTLVFARNYADTNISNSNNSIFSLTVDKTAPVITLNSPTNTSWQNNATGVMFNVSITELYNDSCVLATNLNSSQNTSGTYNFSVERQGYNASIAMVNFSYGWAKLSQSGLAYNWSDNNTGAYLFNVMCNDSAGNQGWLMLGGNATFFVDTVPPSTPFIKTPINFTLSTDLTPTLAWNNVTDLNFSKYEVQLANGTTFSATDLIWQFNTSGNENSTNSTVVKNDGTFIGNISYGKSYFWRVRAYDLAGNINTSTQYFEYRTWGVCSVLVANTWNICAYTMNTSINASSLCDQTSCSFISYYNQTHEFQTYTQGAATNGAMSFLGSGNTSNNQVVFIYTRGLNVTWENRTDDVKLNLFNYTLQNDSSGWNIVPSFYNNLSANVNFQALHKSLNGNGSQANITLLAGGMNITSKFLSKYYAENVSSSRFTSYVANRSFNNFTRIEYGEVVWIHLNKSLSTYYWNSSGEIGNGTTLE